MATNVVSWADDVTEEDYNDSFASNEGKEFVVYRHIPVEPEPTGPLVWTYPVAWSEVVRVGLPFDETLDATDDWGVVVPVPQEPVNEHFECNGCNEHFFFGARQQDTYKERGWSIPKRCRDCNLMKKARDMRIICKSCTKTFPFSARQQDDFKSKGYQTPKVCKDCKLSSKASKASKA